MNKEKIEKIWSGITHSGLGGFEYQLLSKNSIPQLNIGLNEKIQRCLILELPSDFIKSFNEIEKENLSLLYFKRDKCLCILLNDDFYNDLFDDLVLSIFSRICNISSPVDYSDLFVKHFYKWSSFFENKKNEGLNRDSVKGMIGELFFLKNLLINSGSRIDEILTSWRGPYDEAHDFVFDLIDFEIKTIDNSKSTVHISSEYQLESDIGKTLELVVLFVKADHENGLTLKSLINDIKIIVLNGLGDNSIFIKALSQKGLVVGSLDQYEIHRFLPVEQVSYDCTTENFPKLVKSTIPDGITGLNYNIRLNLIEEFLVEKKLF